MLLCELNKEAATIAPTIAFGGGMTSPQNFFSEHDQFAEYVRRAQMETELKARMEAKTDTQKGTRRNLLGLGALGALAGGAIGYKTGGKAGIMPAALAGGALGGLSGVMLPSSIGNVTLGAGIGAIPGAIAGLEFGKKHPQYGMPAMIAGSLGGAALGGYVGK